jgi:transposase
MEPCLAVEGSTTKAVFEAYLERVSAPSLRLSQVVVMDNLSSHEGSRIRELVEARGCELIYLPAYSPDLNHIEEAFAKLEPLLRKAEARTRETLHRSDGQGPTAAVIIIGPECGRCAIPEQTVSVPFTMMAPMITLGSRFLILAVAPRSPEHSNRRRKLRHSVVALYLCSKQGKVRVAGRREGLVRPARPDPVRGGPGRARRVSRLSASRGR